MATKEERIEALKASKDRSGLKKKLAHILGILTPEQLKDPIVQSIIDPPSRTIIVQEGDTVDEIIEEYGPRFSGINKAVKKAGLKFDENNVLIRAV